MDNTTSCQPNGGLGKGRGSAFFSQVGRISCALRPASEIHSCPLDLVCQDLGGCGPSDWLVSVKSYNRSLHKDQLDTTYLWALENDWEKAGFMSCADILCLSVINPSQKSDLKSQLKAA